LVEQIIKGIQLGYLEHDSQLLGTRQLSLILKLNRNTIIKSLEELQAQEWIKIIPNKGTFINAKTHYLKNKISNITTNTFPKEADFTFTPSILIDLPETPIEAQLILDDGQIDKRLIDYKMLTKNYAGVLLRTNKTKSNKNYFEQQFVNYLKISRDLNCNPKNLLIADNQELIIHIICKVFNQNNLNIAIPEINHYKTNIILQTNQVNLHLIKMKENYIDLEHLEYLIKSKNISIVYLPTNYQYPTTYTFNHIEKTAIQQLAINYKFIILEHDPFSDYYYTPNKITPFAASNLTNQTIYLSKFGDFLSQNYNFGFLIGPENFIQEAKKHLYLLEQNRDEIALKVIGEMINEGEIIRILKKHRKIYKERRDYLCNLLYQHFGKNITIKLPKGGLAIWIEWNLDLNLLLLKKELEKKSIYLPQYCLYQNKKQKAIRLGFATLDLDQIENLVKNFLLTINHIKNKKPVI